LLAAAAEPQHQRSRNLLEQVARDSKEVVSAFQQAMSEALTGHLRTLRRALVDFLRSITAKDMQRLWPGALEVAVACVLESGLRAMPRADWEEPVLQALEVDPGRDPRQLATRMLMLRNFEMPIIDDLDSIPDFIRGHYVQYMLAPVAILNAPGHAERVVHYLCALTQFAHNRGISRKGITPTPGVQQLRAAYLERFNCIQAYFSTRNLRRLYVQRGDLTSDLLIAQGFATLHAVAPRQRTEGKLRLGIFAQ